MLGAVGGVSAVLGAGTGAGLAAWVAGGGDWLRGIPGCTGGSRGDEAGPRLMSAMPRVKTN